MSGLQLLPVILSLTILAAHFFRAGNLPMVVVAFVLLGLLVIRRRWVARLIQVALMLGAVEWARTLVTIASMRARAGEPVRRLIIILGCVSLATAASAFVFQTARLKARYRLNSRDETGST